MGAIERLLATAESQIGYKESYNNITKFSADFDEKWPDFYNTKKQGAAWCDIFVDWCFVTTFGYDNALKLLCQPEHSLGAGCTYSARYFRDKLQWHTNPEPGDQIFFGDINDLDHTGIVQKVTDAYVYTIEGNKNNQVQTCKYSLGNKSIAGYGRPDWSIVDGTPEPTPAPTPAPATGYTVGDVYTIVASALNVRQGAGTNYPLVGYDNLTVDGKRHAYRTGALMHGTRVTCLDIKLNGSDVWMQIPSGWCCAIYQGNTYIK